MAQRGERGASHGAGLVEQEAVAGIGHAGHAGGAGGHPGQKAADRHVGVHQVGLFGPEQAVERQERAELRDGRKIAGQRQGGNAKTLGAHIVQQRAVRADADDRVAAVADAAHQRHQKMAQREIDVGDFDDQHRTIKFGRPPLVKGRAAVTQSAAFGAHD